MLDFFFFKKTSLSFSTSSLRAGFKIRGNFFRKNRKFLSRKQLCNGLKLKICVDARMHAHGGIGTYISHLLPYLDVEILSLNAKIYSLNEQIELVRKIPPCDLFWSPHFNVPLGSIRAKHRITTIHDVFHLDRQISFPKRVYAKALLKKAIKNSQKIITVSNFSQRRILHHFPEAKEKIVVIHPGADHLIDITPVPMSISYPFFLFVGSRKSHKNVSFAKKHIPNLVIADGSIPLENLCWLYQNAKALIFPSLYEGWGLPPLEAMSLGCPVIASNQGSIPEACGEAALFFDPNQPEQLMKALDQLEERREEMIVKGKERASLFTWKHCAKLHAEVFAQCLDSLNG